MGEKRIIPTPRVRRDFHSQAAELGLTFARLRGLIAAGLV
jgi:hypothetical protein